MTTITISGPGQTFDDEYCIILKALKDAGFEVIEDNGTKFFSPILNLVGPIPVFAFLPMFLIWFGIVNF